MRIPRSFDVLILGGGPAGVAAAIPLARSGHRVAILERSQPDAVRFGETLPPGARPLLHRLGVWEAFQEDAHLASPGIISAWESDRPYENDFIYNPYGNGWHLDRVRFDRTLVAAAGRAGAEVFRPARIRSCVRTADSGWLLQYEYGGEVREIAATFLIDATGRPAWLARQQGASRIVSDHLVGVIGYGEGSGGEDRRTILEATPDGWWYAARLPNGKVVAAFMTDADLLPRGNDESRRFWKERLRGAPLTSTLLPNPDDLGELRIRPSNTVRLDRIGGPGWLAVGDAAVAYDPLSSQGILKAMESGCRAGEVVIDLLQGNSTAMTAYAAWLDAEFETYSRNYFRYYGQVGRWPQSAFWRRRQFAKSLGRGAGDALPV